MEIDILNLKATFPAYPEYEVIPAEEKGYVLYSTAVRKKFEDSYYLIPVRIEYKHENLLEGRALFFESVENFLEISQLTEHWIIDNIQE